jgi:hypothetical protein
MNNIFTLFSLLVGIMLFGLWSNIHVYAQQPSSVTSGGVSAPISEELKAKMCDPSNPDLKVVNTTEARICGIAKTVKAGLASVGPTSQSTSAASSPTTKPTTATTALPKQQQIANTNNIPRSSGIGAPIVPLGHPTSTLPLGIAPQVKAVKQQQRPPITLINSTAGINGTAGQNYTFAAISPAATSGQVLYLGFHGTVAATNPTHGNSGSKHDDNHDSTRRVSDSSSKDKDTNDRSSTVKKKTTSTKSDRIDSTNAESSSKDKKTHNGESSSDSRSSSKGWTKSDDGSSKQDDSSAATSSSHSENSYSSVIVKSFNPKNSVSSESSSIHDHIPSVIVKSFNFD